MEKQCAACGQPVVGRTDKKYCSDQCRYMNNNQLRQKDKGERMMMQLNSTLRHNRSLLRKLSPAGKTTLGKDVLALLGFDFRYFTHLYRTQRGNTYHFCYDYGYLLLPDEKVLIVNWQPYMEAN